MTAPYDSASSADKPAGIGCVMRLVVLLRFCGDDSKEKRLLPCGRLARAVKPSVGRLARTAQRGNDHGGGIRGEGISEGHGQILPDKKKYAMQKINLAKCPQCRQVACMSNTKYNLYFVNICFANGKGKVMEIVAIDEDAAKADIMETYGNTGINEIQIGKLREA